jgi:hypothetical protein
MTPQETETLLNEIVAGLDTAGTFLGTLDPALIPFIAIGKAVDKLIPGVAASVQGWIEGNPPTAAEKADFLKKLSVLADPNNP